MLALCDKTKISDAIYKNDDYTELISHGLYGIIASYDQLFTIFYSSEIASLSYQSTKQETIIFLNS
jgi:hypothetical protein